MTYKTYRLFIAMPVASVFLWMLPLFFPGQLYILSSCFIIASWILGSYSLWGLNSLQLSNTGFVRTLNEIQILPGLQRELHTQWIFCFFATLQLLVGLFDKVPQDFLWLFQHATLFFSAFTLLNILHLTYALWYTQLKNITHVEPPTNV